MGRIFLSLAVTGLLACTPDLGDAPFLCNTGTPKCPDGYTCNEANVCVKEGTCPVGVPGCPQASTSEPCGDEFCDAEAGETCETCEADCGKCSATVAVCPDGTCDATETCQSCPDDCGQCSSCGDGSCNGTDSCENCPQDCGTCPQPYCGDGSCNGSDTCENCPGDCGACSDPYCGDGSCNGSDTCENCPGDCGACPPQCGDGRCEGNESVTCPADCAPTCTEGATQCSTTEVLEYCENSSWQTANCEDLCLANAYDYAIGCGEHPTELREMCLCADYSQFGELCTDQVLCDTGLFCGRFGTDEIGFCSQYCTTSCSGGPTGSNAQCVLEVGTQTACGFLCGAYGGSCPTGMSCDSVDELCLPDQV